METKKSSNQETAFHLTFLQGFGETLKEAMNCFRCADVRMVRGRLGPRLPSRGREPSSTMKSSPKGPVMRQRKHTEGSDDVFITSRSFSFTYFIPLDVMTAVMYSPPFLCLCFVFFCISFFLSKASDFVCFYPLLSLFPSSHLHKHRGGRDKYNCTFQFCLYFCLLIHQICQ